MAPTTNNKPCVQHTETSGGQPGHTSRTVTVCSKTMVHFKKFSIKTMENFVLAFFPQVIPTTNVFQCTFYELVFNM